MNWQTTPDSPITWYRGISDAISHRAYVIADHPGINGFHAQKPNPWNAGLSPVTGPKDGLFETLEEAKEACEQEERWAIGIRRMNA